MKGRISEVFSSIQGEGVYAGKKQIFVRFYGCNLSCSYCDTHFYSFQEYESKELLPKIESFGGDFHSVSFTGGEPLLQTSFLEKILPLVKQRGLKTYLETNGTLPDELIRIIDLIDIVAMDIKLASSTGQKELYDKHKKFLRAAGEKEVFIKAVICNSTEPRDFKKAVSLAADFNRDVPFILQPNSFQMGRELMEKTEKFQELCFKSLNDVRIIPQMHKIMRVK